MDKFFDKIGECEYVSDVDDLIEGELATIVDPKWRDKYGNNMLHVAAEYIKKYIHIMNDRGRGIRVIEILCKGGVSPYEENNRCILPFEVEPILVGGMFNSFEEFEYDRLRVFMRTIDGLDSIGQNEFNQILPNFIISENIAKHSVINACKYGHVKYVKFFFNSNIFKISPSFVILNTTPIHIAIANDNIEIVQHLIGIGVDMHVLDEYNKTPLCMALQQINISSIWDSIWELTKKQKPSIEYIPPMKGNKTILEYCIQYNRIDAVEWILQNIPNPHFSKIFDLADGNKEILDILIEYIRAKYYA